MRNIKYIAIHCTATPQTATIKSMQDFWKNVKKWTRPGYHYVVMPDGKVVNLLSVDTPSNGVAGFNSVTINIAYVGGLDAKAQPCDTRTPQQKESLLKLLKELKQQFKTAVIQGHRDFSPDKNHNGIIERFEWIKYCPCFEAKKEYEKI